MADPLLDDLIEEPMRRGRQELENRLSQLQS